MPDDNANKHNHKHGDGDESKRREHIERQTDRAPGAQASHDSASLADPMLGSDVQADAPSYPGSLLGKSQLKGRGNSHIRAAVTLQAQSAYGNRAVRRYLQRAPGATPPSSPAPTTSASQLIVDDSAEELQPSQMKRRDFLIQLRAAVNSTVDEALAGKMLLALAVKPMVDQHFGAYSGKDSQSLERAIRKEVPGAAGVANARDYIPMICARVRKTVTEYVEQGGDAPADGKSIPTPSGSPIQDAASLTGIGNILFKRRDGSASEAGDPQAVLGQLGPGHSLNDSVKPGLESAFGQDFSDVQVHTDAGSSHVADSLDARAFTLGQHVAFGPGEYQPGTPTGDALIAHELAHVVQQRGAPASGPMHKGGAEHNALEEDADTTAVGAVVSLWRGMKGGLANVAQNALPTLKSGLRLQRCSKKDPIPSATPEIEANKEAMGSHIVAGMEKANEKGTADSGIHYAYNYQKYYPDKWKDDYWKGFANEDYFKRIGYMKWVLVEGKSASVGIKTWLKGLTIAECASSIIAIQIDALRAAIGDKKFDEHFGSGEGKLAKTRQLIISQSVEHTPLDGLITETESVTKNDPGTENNRPVKRGEWHYFYNHPKYLLKHPGGAWQGENAVCVDDAPGAQKWAGLGANADSESQLYQKMIEGYGRERSERDKEVLNKKFKSPAGWPAEYREGAHSFPDTVTKEMILNDDATEIPNLNNGEVTRRKGGFQPKSGKQLNAAKVQELRGK